MVTTAQEAAERGRAARKLASRRCHGDWKPAPDRPDPVAILERQNASRLPDLVPIRTGRMLRSPFTFFRGAAAVMAADLAATPTTGLTVQLCGDAHLVNFGVFAAPDRDLVFDLNDFDETLPGPWEWDVKRLAASFAIAGRARRFSARERSTATTAALRAYRQAMRRFAAMRTLDVWYARMEVAEQFDRWDRQTAGTHRKAMDKALAKARRKDSLRAFARLTHEVDGQPRIVSDPPLIVPMTDLLGDAELEHFFAGIGTLIRQYRDSLPADRRLLLDGYSAVDSARKVVGVGSVGTRCWIVLLLGHDDDDPLFLQIKEAERSVFEDYAGRSRFGAHGRRVVEGQRLTQAASDVFLGWMRADASFGEGAGHYYVRQLWDAKLSVDIDTIDPHGLEVYAEVCGWTLARAHARTGDRAGIASYLGGSDRFDDAVAEFAERYADQNERDHAALGEAVAAGRLPARDDL